MMSSPAPYIAPTPIYSYNAYSPMPLISFAYVDKNSPNTNPNHRLYALPYSFAELRIVSPEDVSATMNYLHQQDARLAFGAQHALEQASSFIDLISKTKLDPKVSNTLIFECNNATRKHQKNIKSAIKSEQNDLNCLRENYQDGSMENNVQVMQEFLRPRISPSAVTDSYSVWNAIGSQSRHYTRWSRKNNVQTTECPNPRDKNPLAPYNTLPSPGRNTHNCLSELEARFTAFDAAESSEKEAFEKCDSHPSVEQRLNDLERSFSKTVKQLETLEKERLANQYARLHTIVQDEIDRREKIKKADPNGLQAQKRHEELIAEILDEQRRFNSTR